MGVYKLKDICHIEKGKQIDTDNLSEDNSYKYINGGIKESGYYYDYNTEGNTITVSEGGASCGYVNYVADKFWCGCHCYRLTECKFNSKYIYYALKGNQSKIMALRTGAAMPNIKKSTFEALELTLTDNEQEQINIIEKFEKIDSLIENTQNQLTKLDELVKSRFIEMFGKCKESKKLKDYAVLITKGASPKWQGFDYCDEGVLFVTSENVREGFLDLSKRKYLPQGINDILPRSVLQKNDILINIVNASIGRAAVYDSDELANINQAVALVRLKPNTVNHSFILTYLNSDKACASYNFMKVGGDKANLSLKNISNLKIPVASMEHQLEFDRFKQQVDKLKFEIKKSLEKLETLKKSLMQEYFG